MLMPCAIAGVSDMRSLLVALPLAAVLVVSAPAHAQPVMQAPADGRWTLRLSCAESAPDAQGRRLPSFTSNIAANISGGQISRELRYPRPNNQSVNVTETWSGTVSGSNFTLNVRGEDTAGGRWSYSFSGRVLRTELLSGQGQQFREPSRLVSRLCTVDLAPAGQAQNIFADVDRSRQQEAERRAQEPEAERRRQAEQRRAAEDQRRHQTPTPQVVTTPSAPGAQPARPLEGGVGTRSTPASREERWEPATRAGMATIGAVRFSPTRLTTVSGDSLNLVAMGPIANFVVPVASTQHGAVRSVTADIYRVDPPGDVRGIATTWICGSSARRPVTFVAIWVARDFQGRDTADEREVAFFTGITPPRRADQPEPCMMDRFIRVGITQAAAASSQPRQPPLSVVPANAGRPPAAPARPRLTRCDQLAASADTFDGFAALVEAGLNEESVAMGRTGGVTFQAINPQQAIPACREAATATPSNARVWFQLGRALERGNQLPQAITAYERGAELGSLDAVNNLGELYRDGKGVARDPARAEALFRRAAEGSVEATASLTEMLIRRDGANAFDEALTLIAAVTPTDLSISTRVLTRMASVAGRVPEQVRSQPPGPGNYEAGIQIIISPNRPDGRFCFARDGRETCLAPERLSITSGPVAFERADPTELVEDSAEISGVGSLSLSLLARDVFRLRYIHRATLELRQPIAGTNDRDISLEDRALRSVSAGCWQGDVMRVCLTRPAPTNLRQDSAPRPQGAASVLGAGTSSSVPTRSEPAQSPAPARAEAANSAPPMGRTPSAADDARDREIARLRQQLAEAQQRLSVAPETTSPAAQREAPVAHPPSWIEGTYHLTTSNGHNMLMRVVEGRLYEERQSGRSPTDWVPSRLSAVPGETRDSSGTPYRVTILEARPGYDYCVLTEGDGFEASRRSIPLTVERTALCFKREGGSMVIEPNVQWWLHQSQLSALRGVDSCSERSAPREDYCPSSLLNTAAPPTWRGTRM